jgi:hypothetical protein
MDGFHERPLLRPGFQKVVSFKRIRDGLSYAPVFNVWIDIGVELPDTVIIGHVEEIWL